MQMDLEPHTVEWLVKLATDNPAQEVCGFILGDGSIWEIPNVSETPEHNFFMDPIAQLDFLKECKTAGDIITGVFHSHPGGDPQLSPTDARGWHPAMKWQYYVVTAAGVVEYQRGVDGDITEANNYPWAG